MTEITLSKSVCLCICLSACVSKNLTAKFHQIFYTYYCDRGSVLLWQRVDGVMCYIHPFLWMTRCFHIMEQVGQNHDDACFVEFARWRQRGPKLLFLRLQIAGLLSKSEITHKQSPHTVEVCRDVGVERSTLNVLYRVRHVWYAFKRSVLSLSLSVLPHPFHSSKAVTCSRFSVFIGRFVLMKKY